MLLYVNYIYFFSNYTLVYWMFAGRIEDWITETVSGVVDSINEWMIENDMEIALAVVDGCMESVNMPNFMEGEDLQYAGLLQ